MHEHQSSGRREQRERERVNEEQKLHSVNTHKNENKKLARTVDARPVYRGTPTPQTKDKTRESQVLRPASRTGEPLVDPKEPWGLTPPP